MDAALAGLVISALVFGFLTLRDGGLGWAGTWWLWLFVLPYPLLAALLLQRERINAGADWLRVGRVEIDTYQLVQVLLRPRTGSPYLELKDAAGRGLAVTLAALQRNRELWDLVYNGILHSVIARGAHTDTRTRAELRIPG